MHVTVQDGVRFYEGRPAGCRLMRPIKVELGGVFKQAQLKTLKDVKALMAKRAKAVGGNAIVDFEYGQETLGCLRAWLHLDHVVWHGSGRVARVPED